MELLLPASPSGGLICSLAQNRYVRKGPDLRIQRCFVNLISGLLIQLAWFQLQYCFQAAFKPRIKIDGIGILADHKTVLLRG